jgi:hypothetical protein
VIDIVERLEELRLGNKEYEVVVDAIDEIKRLRNDNQKLALDLIAALGQWFDNDEQNAALKEGE